jgi:hypothetical protein
MAMMTMTGPVRPWKPPATMQRNRQPGVSASIRSLKRERETTSTTLRSIFTATNII